MNDTGYLILDTGIILFLFYLSLPGTPAEAGGARQSHTQQEIAEPVPSQVLSKEITPTIDEIASPQIFRGLAMTGEESSPHNDLLVTDTILDARYWIEIERMLFFFTIQYPVSNIQNQSVAKPEVLLEMFSVV
jgi:hypothetical protein